MFWSWRNDDFQGKLEQWHRDSQGIASLEMELRRGDFVERSQIWRARRWVWTRKRKIRREFLNSPEGAGVKAANAAWVSAWTAIVAILISIIAVGFSWLAYIKPDSIQKVQLQSDTPILVELKEDAYPTRLFSSLPTCYRWVSLYATNYVAIYAVFTRPKGVFYWKIGRFIA